MRYDHSITDYKALVKSLIAENSYAEAMSLAVGGAAGDMGEAERKILVDYGLLPHHNVVDVGCGSGRLARRLKGWLTGKYVGIDVVPELLDYARNDAPDQAIFYLTDGRTIPVDEFRVDFITFFSVFTHLLPEESYAYLVEACRVCARGGRIVVSFLEYATNWQIFEDTVRGAFNGHPAPHLNMFLGLDALIVWAKHLGLDILSVQEPTPEFGQSLIVFVKP